jgi:hypothetical protein
MDSVTGEEIDFFTPCVAKDLKGLSSELKLKYNLT